MAYVPKREPCCKCKNPIFFAERLIIEEQLYHRTCFRCARCSSVLTLGNFYQTEKDNEFCCETCPDEERTRLSNNNENRLSIAQRIALFEKETSSVLKKSLSDEEKSKSLSRQLPSTSPSSQGLSKFLSAQIGTPDQAESEKDIKTVNSLSSDSETDEDERDSEKEDVKPEINSVISNSNVATNISDVDTTKEITFHNENAQQTLAVTSQEIENFTIASTDDINDLSNLHDDIELEFEKLAEEAVKSPVFTPKVSVQNKSPSPLLQIVQEKVDEIEAIELNANIIARSETLKEESNDFHEVVLNQDNHSEENRSEYPDDLNPFGDEDENVKTSVKRPSLNPFGSCSEDEENDSKKDNKSINTGMLPKPPRPPPPKTISKPVSTNPFGSDDDEEEKQLIVRTPVPTPRRL